MTSGPFDLDPLPGVNGCLKSYTMAIVFSCQIRVVAGCTTDEMTDSYLCMSVKAVVCIRKGCGLSGRGSETVGPVSPIGHRDLRSDLVQVLLVQMSKRGLEILECF